MSFLYHDRNRLVSTRDTYANAIGDSDTYDIAKTNSYSKVSG